MEYSCEIKHQNPTPTICVRTTTSVDHLPARLQHARRPAQADEQFRARAGLAANSERAFQVRNSLAHLAQPKVHGWVLPAGLARIKAAAIIAQRQDRAAISLHHQLNKRSTCTGMLTNIIQTLLNDAKQGQLVICGQALRRAGDAQQHIQAVLAAEPGHPMGERREKALRFHVQWPQRKDRAANIFDQMGLCREDDTFYEGVLRLDYPR